MILGTLFIPFIVMISSLTFFLAIADMLGSYGNITIGRK